MLYTGYFAYTKKYEDAGLKTIAVSGSVPPFYVGERALFFAPRKSTFYDWKMGKISTAEYTTQYEAYLETLDKDYIGGYLEGVQSDKNAIFLCYEKPEDFCHRHILADWIQNKFGYKVEEYEVKKK